MTVELVHGAECECVRCRSFQPGNEWALKHGATSENQIRPLARNHRRRLLRQIGLRAGDLDPVGRAHLEHYCRLAAKIVLLDRYFDEQGFLDPEGRPQPSAELYVRLHRAALSALGKLEAHLETRTPTLEEQLAELRRSG